MLQPNPERPPEFPPSFKTLPRARIAHEDYSYAPYYETRPDLLALDLLPTLELPPEKAKIRPRTYVMRAVAGVALVGTLGYAADVGSNIDHERRAQPSISTILDPQNQAYKNHATLFDSGFNEGSADKLTTSVGPGIQTLADGEAWSVHSNNTIGNSEAVFDKTIELAQLHGITSASVVTYSMGDMRGIQTADKIATRSNIPVDLMVVISGPSSFDGLRETKKEEMALANGVVHTIPASANSTLLRYAFELASYMDRITRPEANPIDYVVKNTERLNEIITNLSQQYSTGNYTSGSYLLGQIDAIRTTDIEGSLKHIGQAAADGKTQVPLLIYVATDGYDNVVDDEYSANEFKRFAEEAGIDFMIVKVKDVIHSQYDRPEAVQAFNLLFTAISPEVKAIIAKNKADFYEQRYGPYLLDITKPR